MTVLMSHQLRSDTQQLSALNGAIVIGQSSRAGYDWELRDTEFSGEIVVCPSEVPELVALLKAFRALHGPSGRIDEEYDHTCSNWLVVESVTGSDRSVGRCLICNGLHEL